MLMFQKAEDSEAIFVFSKPFLQQLLLAKWYSLNTSPDKQW